MILPDFYDEINDLVNDILEHKVKKEETRIRINKLKNQYGEDAFPGIHFNKSLEPWDAKYLQKLKEMNITGACSEEFLLHMAEVSEAVAARRKKIIICLGILVAVLMILGIALLVWLFGGVPATGTMG